MLSGPSAREVGNGRVAPWAPEAEGGLCSQGPQGSGQPWGGPAAGPDAEAQMEGRMRVDTEQP